MQQTPLTTEELARRIGGSVLTKPCRLCSTPNARVVIPYARPDGELGHAAACVVCDLAFDFPRLEAA